MEFSPVDIRKSAKAKVKRLVDEKYVKTDSSDWSPSEPLNTEEKNAALRPKRRAYKKGGSVIVGKKSHARGDRKAKGSGGKLYNVEPDKSLSDNIYDSTVSGRALKKGLDYMLPSPKKKVDPYAEDDNGGVTEGKRSGGRTKKATGGGNPYIPESASGSRSIVRNAAGFKKGGKAHDNSKSHSSGKRAHRAMGGILGNSGMVPPQLMPNGLNGGMGGMAAAQPMMARAYKRGGKVGKKTNIHININTAPKTPPMPPLGAGLPMGAPPIMPHPPMTPPLAVPPGVMAGAGGAPPPPMPPPMPMARKHGGRTAYKLDNASGGGLGRLEKKNWYGKKP